MKLSKCSLCKSKPEIVKRGQFNDEYVTCSNRKCILQSIYPMQKNHWNQLHKTVEAQQEESRELQALFELQHSRVKKAEAYWRKKTKASKNVKPDLGKLIDFLMGKIWELEQMKTPLKSLKATKDLEKRITDLENRHLVYGNALSKQVGHEL